MEAIIRELVLSNDPEHRHGLERMRIEGMPPVMAITGPNGSGKSRLLNCIKDAMEAPNKERNLRESLQRSGLARLEQEHAMRQPGLAPSMLAEATDQLNLMMQDAIQLDIQLMALPKISMVPAQGVKVLELKSRRPDMLSIEKAKNSDFVFAASMLGQISNFDGAMENAKRRIFKLSQDYIAVRSDAIAARDDARNIQATKRYMVLNDIVLLLLGERLGHDVEHTVTIFGKPLDEAKLSDGQGLLLQFAAALCGIRDQEPCVVLLGEPENHLHPKAQIQLLGQLKKALPNGQIIIATHSVPLLAHVGVGNIWSMKDGRLSKSGKDVQEVLTGLMGHHDDIDRMRDFIDEPERIAAVEFAKECLVAPQPASFNEKDPQQDQMVEGLGVAWPAGRPLRIVDWGAGRGRLATPLREHLLVDQGRAASGVEYFAFNPFCSPEDREVCLAAMSVLDPDKAVERFLTRPEEAVAVFAKAKADAVVLCNCLHEIEPMHWPEVFAQIAGCLSEDGLLVMVEDLEISVGELAFPHGFFLLDAKGMANLLGVEVDAFKTSFHHDPRYAGRLVRYLVPRRLLTGVRQESVRAAIEQGKCSALEKIEALRAAKPAFETMPEREARLYGRRHGLFAQQVANAILFLEGHSKDIPVIEG